MGQHKTFQMVLSDKNDVIDLHNLKQLTFHFCIPDEDRCYAWKLLLEILPIHIKTHEFINEQRRRQYFDLVNAVRLLRLVDTLNVSKDQLFWSCMIISNPKLRFENVDQSFSRIVQVLCEIIDKDNEVDLYWFSVRIWHLFKTNNEFNQNGRKIGEKIRLFLTNKDYQEVVEYFDKTKLFMQLPFEKWFLDGFSLLIESSSLCKIWDKLIAGSSKILVFVAIALIICLKEPLITARDLNEAVHIIETIDANISENVVHKALDMWQQHAANIIQTSLK